MRRVGSRIQLAIARWRRVGRQLELLRFRQRWARKFSEYECAGGPLDGKVRDCMRHGTVVVDGGYYSVDRKDCRLHFHEFRRVPSNWSGQ